jgi:hypothetical protein
MTTADQPIDKSLEAIMKTELLYLALTAVLTGVLWIPVVVG